MPLRDLSNLTRKGPTLIRTDVLLFYNPKRRHSYAIGVSPLRFM